MSFERFAAICRLLLFKSNRRSKKSKTFRRYKLSLVYSIMIGFFTIGYLNCGQKRSAIDDETNLQSIQHVFLKSSAPVKAVPTKNKTSTFIDLAIQPFDQTPEGKKYIAKFGKPLIYDVWGYLPIQTYYDKLRMQKSKTASFQKLNSLIVEKAHASDVGELPGQVNCRADVTETGYFEAFFEDVAAETGVGYDDPNFGQARRDAVCEVLQEIATLIKLDQTHVTPDIVFTVAPENMPATALAGASAFYGLYQNLAGPDNGSLYKHIIERQDPTPGIGSFDAFIMTNFQMPWSVDSGLNANTYDFHTVMEHEVLHAMGFMSSLPAIVNSSGNSVNHNTFSQHLYKEEPTAVANRYFTFTQPLSPLLQVPNGSPSSWFVNNTSMYQGRKNIVGASLDDARPLYSPAYWQQGSSISHFDMDRSPAGTEYVMNTSIDSGIERNMHEHEKEVLCHLGYQVLGMNGCEGASPVAKNDWISNDTFCKKFAVNDISFSGGTLSMDSFEIIDLPAGAQINFDTETDNCSGPSMMSITTNPMGAKSIRVANYTGLPYVFKYRVKDSITNRISDPAFIRYAECTSDPLEHVCNGDFELGANQVITSYGHNNAVLPGYVDYWKSASGTPDLVFRNNSAQIPQGANACNLPWVDWAGHSHDMVDGGNYAAFIASSINASPNPSNQEGITTELKTSLVPGQSYTLSFDVKFYSDFNVSTSQTIKGVLHTQNLESVVSSIDINGTLWSTYIFNPEISNAHVVLNESVPVNSGEGYSWVHLSQTFVATEAFEYLAIFPPLENTSMYAYIDNISIKPVTTTTSISGRVYNDTNANGVQDAGEQGLGGVAVGLFGYANPNAIVPIQFATSSSLPNELGNYAFEFVMSSGNLQYFVGILPENSFEMITEPLQNTFNSDFNHPIMIVPNGTANIENQNFGVVLDGQGEPDLIIHHVAWKTENDADFGNQSVTYHLNNPTDFKVTIKNMSPMQSITLPLNTADMDLDLSIIFGPNDSEDVPLTLYNYQPVTIPPLGTYDLYVKGVGKLRNAITGGYTHQLQFELDGINVISESNDNNNTSALIPFTVTP